MMRNSSNQVKLLIWASSKAEPNTIAVHEWGHVEICVHGQSYGFGPDRRLGPPEDAIARTGCQGILLSRPFAPLVLWHVDRVLALHEDEALYDPKRHNKLPVVWSFAFDASEQQIERLVHFLDSKVKQPPLYAALARKKRNTFNCQTLSLEALREVGIFAEPTLTSVYPDGLLNLLKQSHGLYPGLKTVEKLQLSPPQFLVRDKGFCKMS